MAHLSFGVVKEQFLYWVTKIQNENIEILNGPSEQRGGQTILFKTPGKNIIEICYPDARTSIEKNIY